MIQILLTKYWVLAHLLVIAGTLCFDPTPSVVVGLWGVATVLIMTLCLPPILKGESFWMARQRIALSLKRDVLLYAAGLAVLYVGIQLLNGPRELVYAAELKRWIFSDPACPGLPSSVGPAAGVSFFVGLLGGVGGALVVRNALPRKQRLLLLIGLGCLTGLLALGGILVQLCTGTAPAFAWFGDAFSAGMLWLLMLCVQLGLVLETFLEHHRKMLITSLTVASFNLLGCLVFGSIVAVLMTLVVLVLYLLFSAVVIRGSGLYPRFVWFCGLWLPILLCIGIAVSVRSFEAVAQLFDVTLWGEQVSAFTQQWSLRSGLALDVFGKNPMLGVGPDGLTHFGPACLNGKLEWSLWRAGGTAWSCDFLRLLATCGLMGTVLLLIPGGVMLGRCMMRWVEYYQHSPASRHHQYSLRYLFVLIGSLVGVVCMLVAAWLGTPLHSPAGLCIFLLVCACMGGWMPRRR